jgi:hypothetical protein
MREKIAYFCTDDGGLRRRDMVCCGQSLVYIQKFRLIIQYVNNDNIEKIAK